MQRKMKYAFVIDNTQCIETTNSHHIFEKGVFEIIYSCVFIQYEEILILR